jgi:beta-glucosidase/6-phospho-beta-glucosidase/beta-galactosidase
MLRLREDGVPIVGFTWYSLTDQMDWDTALREDAHRVNAVGLYDLDRQVRKVGSEYRRLIQDWREFLPSGSSALMLV